MSPGIPVQMLVFVYTAYQVFTSSIGNFPQFSLITSVPYAAAVCFGQLIRYACLKSSNKGETSRRLRMYWPEQMSICRLTSPFRVEVDWSVKVILVIKAWFPVHIFDIVLQDSNRWSGSFWFNSWTSLNWYHFAIYFCKVGRVVLFQPVSLCVHSWTDLKHFVFTRICSIKCSVHTLPTFSVKCILNFSHTWNLTHQIQ